jgi:hypothetical protein
VTNEVAIWVKDLFFATWAVDGHRTVVLSYRTEAFSEGSPQERAPGDQSGANLRRIREFMGCPKRTIVNPR